MKADQLISILLLLLLGACGGNPEASNQAKGEGKPTVKEADLLEGLVVADFGASWCGPCRTREPIFKKVSEELKASATFLKIDVDAHSTLSQKYGIKSIPTFLILKDGEVVEKKVGVVSAKELKSSVEKWAGES